MKYRFHHPAEFAEKRAVIRQALKDMSAVHAELLFVALNEAVNNAFAYGCAAETDQGLEIEAGCSDAEVYIRVSQAGRGPSAADIHRQLPDDLAEHGRGIAIIRLCTDYAEYDDDGRTLIMRKMLNQPN